MTNGQRTAQRLDEIIQAAVAQGQAMRPVTDQDLAVVVPTQRAADETGLPAVCDEI
jgi:hypothetical protein